MLVFLNGGQVVSHVSIILLLQNLKSLGPVPFSLCPLVYTSCPSAQLGGMEVERRTTNGGGGMAGSLVWGNGMQVLCLAVMYAYGYVSMCVCVMCGVCVA